MRNISIFPRFVSGQPRKSTSACSQVKSLYSWLAYYIEKKKGIHDTRILVPITALTARYAGHLLSCSQWTTKVGGVKRRGRSTVPEECGRIEVGGSHYRCRPEDLHSPARWGMPRSRRTVHSSLSLLLCPRRGGPVSRSIRVDAGRLT